VGASRDDGARVAVKLLRADLADDDQIVERFLRERKVLPGLDNPHLVKLHDLVVEGAVVAIVMELVDGPDLRRYLCGTGRLDVAGALALVADVLSALVIVHGAGIVHRDIKLENILLSGLPDGWADGTGRDISTPAERCWRTSEWPGSWKARRLHVSPG
jgi:serine/threonine-protein kinase